MTLTGCTNFKFIIVQTFRQPDKNGNIQVKLNIWRLDSKLCTVTMENLSIGLGNNCDMRFSLVYTIIYTACRHNQYD